MPVPRMSPITKNSRSPGPIARSQLRLFCCRVRALLRHVVRHVGMVRLEEAFRHLVAGNRNTRVIPASGRQNCAYRATTTSVTTITATPPAVAAAPGPYTAAAGPCQRSASRGPPATTTMNTPCIRPRISSVATVCSIDDRYTELTRSPAPATARHSTASQSEWVRPNRATPAPHTQIASGHRDALAA